MAGTVKIEVDGKLVEVATGTMVMEAATKIGAYVPHFCYHKKLSIAANCRMCLVEVEKAPKPMPACATPVTDGMKVWTQSVKAKQAQNGVMEFLLINHPLDCPICDQGGECQLQDLAVGYGASSSRYDEQKRVVERKDVGPLVATEEMSRCIHCTRCVRFGQEVAGLMELGMIGRGEHSEIVSFVDKTVDSELSGNMIDICPVGALTSKPFRYSARTWELARRKSISPHDSLGANLIVQVKQNKVMRVLPHENDELNECWLSDKDRFSYEALNSDERLLKPMVRDASGWRETDWETALARVTVGLKDVVAKHGGGGLGVLATAHSTLEELTLAARLARGLGCDNIDFRLRQSDFSNDILRAGIPWLGLKVTDLGRLDAALVIGSFLRKDHPLIAQRLRQAAKGRLKLTLLHVADDEQLMNIAAKNIVAPGKLVNALAQIVHAVADLKAVGIPAAVASVAPDDLARAIATRLVAGKDVAVLLGNVAVVHPRAAQLHALAQLLTGLLGARLGVLGEAANSVGGYLAGAVPTSGGLNAAAMLASPRAGYVLVNAEPEIDSYDPATASAALRAAEFVVALTAYRTDAIDYADVLLPIAPFTETAGAFVNTEGRLQSFNAVVRPAGDARPGWKVLRMLGTLLGLAGFDQDSSEQVREALIKPQGIAPLLSNVCADIAIDVTVVDVGTERIADVPIYFTDATVRRAASLQQTTDAQPPRAFTSTATATSLGIIGASKVKVRQGGGDAVLDLAIDNRLPDGCIRVAAGHRSTASLGAMFGPISVERA